MASEQYLMDRRLELQQKLEDILGNENVYFQPPESMKIDYPAIVYERVEILTPHASNKPYLLGCTYRITLIDKNPISGLLEKLSLIPAIKHTRHYVADQLNHDVFTLQY